MMNLTSMLWQHFVLLSFTILIECLFAFACRYRTKRLLGIVALVQVVTNVPLVFISNVAMHYYLQSDSIVVDHNWTQFFIFYYILTLILEITVVIVEGLIYKNYISEMKHPFIFSLIANILSCGIGFIMQYTDVMSFFLNLVE